jgi:hypothetical protein
LDPGVAGRAQPEEGRQVRRGMRILPGRYTRAAKVVLLVPLGGGDELNGLGAADLEQAGRGWYLNLGSDAESLPDRQPHGQQQRGLVAVAQGRDLALPVLSQRQAVSRGHHQVAGEGVVLRVEHVREKVGREEDRVGKDRLERL